MAPPSSRRLDPPSGTGPPNGASSDGWACSLLFLAPFPAFKAVHLQHLFLGPMARNTRTNRWARTVSIAVLSLLLGAVLLGIAAGVGAQLFWLWLLPAWLASGVLAFAFDWLPHRPHDTTDRWTNARVLDLPVLPFLLLGQSRHLVYPLWPRVPFYRYVMVFRAHRAELEAHGSPIISLDAPPTTPNTGPS